MIAPPVCAFLSALAILPPIVRTLRLWWKRMLYTVPPRHEVHDKQFVEEYASMQHHYCAHHHCPVYATSYAPSHAPSHALSQQPQVRPVSQAAEEIKSIPSSRPQSGLSDQTLTHYPNIMSAAHTSPPTRAASQATALPAYSSRVEVGSKVGR